MTTRNLSPQEMFRRMAEHHVPKHAFSDFSGESFTQWKSDALPEVISTLGTFPDKVPTNPELLVEWEQDGLKKQRWVIDVAPYIAAIVVLNIPPEIDRNERRPAILCWHGHGDVGKDAVMGNDSSEQLRTAIAKNNYDYGRQMARAGYVTFGLDWIGQGERNDNRKPHFLANNGTRDWCNLYYLHATMLGMTSISINVAHGMAATDFVQDLPFVDGDRLGVMGLSGGGTMTLYSSLCDERFKASEIACYSDLFAKFAIRDLQYCGMQAAPGLFNLVDLPDLQGLLAPQPLLVDIGVYDTCFQVDNAMACFRQVQRIYEAAGAPQNLELDLFPNEHSWGGNKSLDFFGERLDWAPR